MSGLLQDLLGRKWGDEWSALTVAQQIVVEADYTAARSDDQINYDRNIGKGNLASYANTLLVEAAQDWAAKVAT